MKNQFDNSKVEDGKERISIPGKMKKGGGKIPWGKCVIFLVLIALVICYGVLVYRSTGEKTITEKQWIAMLSESFGIRNAGELPEATDEIATGRYAAVTAMKVVGRNNLAYLSGKDVVSEEDLVLLAEDYGVVPEKLMKRKMTETDAADILYQAEQFYYDPYNYPEYCDVQFKDSVVEHSDVELISYDEEKGSAVISAEDGKVAEDSIIVLEVEPGICKAFRVGNIRSGGEKEYKVSLKKVEELSEVVDCIDFSGTADFSSMFRDETAGEPEENREEARRGGQGGGMGYAALPLAYAKMPLCPSAEIRPASAETAETSEDSDSLWGSVGKSVREKKEKVQDKLAVNEEFTAKVDLEMGGKISASQKNDGKESYTCLEYAKFSRTDETGKKESENYEVSVNDKGKVKLSQAENDFKVDVEVDEALKNKEDDDSSGFSGSMESSLSYKVSIKDFSIFGSTYFQTMDWDDEKNYVDCRVSGDMELEGKLTGKMEGKFPIFEQNFPIPVTGGIVSVGIRVYLVVTSSGEITVTYEIVNAHASLYASAEGLDLDAGVDGTDFDLCAKLKLEAGPDVEVALAVLGFDLLDPSTEIRVIGSAETLPLNEGFEAYPKCVQLSVAGPTLKIVFMGEDNVLNKILTKSGWSISPSYTILDEEHAPLKKTLHVETEPDGTVNVWEGSADEVCTHRKREEEKPQNLQDLVDGEKEEIREKMDARMEKKRREAEEEAERMLENWLNENCGGCCY